MKKTLALFFAVLIFLSGADLRIAALNADGIVPATSGTTSDKYFTALPTVLEMGDGYAVVWATSFDGTGYIVYTYGGKQYKVYDMKNGIAVTNDCIHVVKVPHEHLSGNTYTVYSTEVKAHYATSVTFGTTVSCGPIRLKGYTGQKDIKLLVFTDIHSTYSGNLSKAKNAAKYLTEDPDMIVFSGDICNYIQTKKQLAEEVFGVMGTLTGGRYPSVYCRGNHETRGQYGSMLMEYLPTSTGKLYFDFTYGPLYSVVLDTGEDKDDGSEEYGGLVEYKEFHAEQIQWMNKLKKNTSAKYRLGIYHIPTLNSLANGIVLSTSVKHLDLQFAITGHYHNSYLRDPGTYGVPYPTLVAGGFLNPGYAAAFVTFSDSGVGYKVVDEGGAVQISGSVPYTSASPDGDRVYDIYGKEPEEPAGEDDPELTPFSGSLSVTAGPAVFETGGDWYNVVWATDDTAAGYVEYNYLGKTYTVYDSIGGNRRTYDRIHSVKVPKEHLNNNSYKVCSFHMNVHKAYSFERGASAESGTFFFEDHSRDGQLNIAVCPDVRENGDMTNTNKMKASVCANGIEPGLVILNGDTAKSYLASENSIVNIIKAAGILSDGAHPVVFARGNSECRGPYATALLRYIPTVEGEFFYRFSYGNKTFIVIDTGEDKEDGHSEYSGLVDFTSLRIKQDAFIRATAVAGEKIAVAHINRLSDYFGYDWESLLKTKNCGLILYGHAGTFGTSAGGVFRIVCGGANGSTGKTAGTSLLIGGGAAHIKAYDDGGVRIFDGTVNLADGSDAALSSIEPETADGVYRITEPAHLVWMAMNCGSQNGFEGKTFRLENDIEMKNILFTPIGGDVAAMTDSDTSSPAFCGTFDGNGFAITDLYIESRNTAVGLFGAARNAVIKNVRIKSGYIEGKSYVGGIAGFAFNTYIYGCCSGAYVFSNGTKTGGIAGFISGGTRTESCGNTGTVVSSSSEYCITGGVVGQSFSMTNEIKNCFNTGTAIHKNGTSSSLGGILGRGGLTTCAIINCYNAAHIWSKGQKGAIVSDYNASGNVSVANCHYDSSLQSGLNGTAAGDSWSTAAGSGTVFAHTTSYMKSASFAELLDGTAFLYDETLNGGYPVNKGFSGHPGRIVFKSGSGVTVTGDGCCIAPYDMDGDAFIASIVDTYGLEIDRYGTGGTVSIEYGGEIKDSMTVILRGDADGDGRVTVNDYLAIKAHFKRTAELTGVFFTAADVCGNGTLTVSDYIMIRRLAR